MFFYNNCSFWYRYSTLQQNRSVNPRIHQIGTIRLSDIPTAKTFTPVGWRTFAFLRLFQWQCNSLYSFSERGDQDEPTGQNNGWLGPRPSNKIDVTADVPLQCARLSNGRTSQLKRHRRQDKKDHAHTHLQHLLPKNEKINHFVTIIKKKPFSSTSVQISVRWRCHFERPPRVEEKAQKHSMAEQFSANDRFWYITLDLHHRGVLQMWFQSTVHDLKSDQTKTMIWFWKKNKTTDVDRWTRREGGLMPNGLNKEVTWAKSNGLNTRLHKTLTSSGKGNEAKLVRRTSKRVSGKTVFGLQEESQNTRKCKRKQKMVPEKKVRQQKKREEL